MDRIACILGFDLRGGRRRRIDDCFALTDRSRSPFHLTFTRLLRESPGAFTWSIGLDSPPAVRVEWRSALADCGVVHVFLGDAPAALSIFLPGRNRVSETAAIEGVAAAMASRP